LVIENDIENPVVIICDKFEENIHRSNDDILRSNALKKEYRIFDSTLAFEETGT